MVPLAHYHARRTIGRLADLQVIGLLVAAAAFFDLDKTLMAGSSGIFFARAAYETGMISRGRLARDAYENLRFRLRGSTDDRADAVRKRVGQMIAGVGVRDMRRLSPARTR